VVRVSELNVQNQQKMSGRQVGRGKGIRGSTVTVASSASRQDRRSTKGNSKRGGLSHEPGCAGQAKGHGAVLEKGRRVATNPADSTRLRALAEILEHHQRNAGHRTTGASARRLALRLGLKSGDEKYAGPGLSEQRDLRQLRDSIAQGVS